MPSPQQISNDDLFTLIMIGCLAGPTVGVGFAVAKWHQVLGWLLEHQVLLSAKSHPLLTVPATGGAGLDTARTTVATAVVLAVLAIGMSALRRRRLTGEELAR
jgi:hypothetical protein